LEGPPGELWQALLQADLPDDDHLSWDELRRRPHPVIEVEWVDHVPMESPEETEFQHLRFNRCWPEHHTEQIELTAEQWWVTLRERRRQRARSIKDLQQSDGQPFSYVLTDKVLKTCDQLAAALKGEVGVGGEVLHAGSRDRYIAHSLEEEAISSSQLEGAATTRRDAQRMLREKRTPRTHGEQMILNNHRAMEQIREWRDQPLTPGLICALHRIVTADTLDDPADAGRLQASDDGRVGVYSNDDVLLHQPPPTDQLAARLDILCRFANSELTGPYLPGVVRALIVHFMMGYNHFFADGNGRTARSLFYWVMLREGYWLSEYITISKILNNARTKYGNSFLYVETDEGDLTYFLHYHLDVLARAVAQLAEYVHASARELTDVKRRLDPASGEFNLRQAALLGEAFKARDLTLTAQGVASQFRVSTVTAHHDLDDLVGRGWLTRQRVGHRFVWQVTMKIAELGD
jgi:Fic family protein